MGYITVVFRFEDRRVAAQERSWDVSVPWLRDPRCFRGEPEHVRAYLAQPSEQGIAAVGKVAPMEEGIVVYDYAAGSLLCMQSRHQLDSFSFREALDCVQRREANQGKVALLHEMLAEQRLNLRVRTIRGDGETLTLTPIQGGIDEVWAHADAWYGRVLSGGRRPGPPVPIRREDLQIDTRPLTYIGFEPSLAGALELRRTLEEAGFEISSEAETAWDAWRPPAVETSRSGAASRSEASRKGRRPHG